MSERFANTMDRDGVEVPKYAKKKKRTMPTSRHLERISLVNKGFIIFSVFISHVIKTKNRNRSIKKIKNLGYDR